MWYSIPNGVHAVNAIETVILTWAGTEEISQLLIGTGCLKSITDCCIEALNIAEELTSVSSVHTADRIIRE